jgi:hypothetical protein
MGLCMALILACSFLSSSETENTPAHAPAITQAMEASPKETSAPLIGEEPAQETETVGEKPAAKATESDSAQKQPPSDKKQAINWEQPVYADDFVDIYSGWPNDPGGTFGYPEAFKQCANPTGNPRFPCEASPETQVYQMNIDGNTNPPIYVSALEGYEYGPVGLEIEATVLENSLGHAFYGFVCHYRDAGNYNALIVSTKGHTGIFKLENGKTDYLYPSDLDEKFQAYMQKTEADHAAIALRAECNGDALFLSAGGNVLAETTGGLSEPGLNGLIAGVEKENDKGLFSINFDNYKVFEP